MLGVNHQQLAELALAGTPGANGVTLLPYLDGERTPNRPNAKGQFYGITTTTSREDIARAVVEGLLCSMRDAIEALLSIRGSWYPCSAYSVLRGSAVSIPGRQQW